MPSPGIVKNSGRAYNWLMDVLIIPEAQREIDALRAFRPRPGTWGVVVGHRRGPRFIVEKVAAAGNPGTAPDERLLDGVEKVWPGRLIGIAVVRPDAAFKRALLGPAWYGKLVLELAGSVKAPALRPCTVEFKRSFFFDPVPLAPAAKEEAHE
jgi:hypothetical protein